MPLSNNKIFYEFNPFELAGIEEPEDSDDTKQKIADMVLEEVLNYVGKSSSPVAGEGWKKSLSPEYKKIKAKVSSNLSANMELYGGMLDALECVVNSNGNIELRITGDEEVSKADGHNNFSGLSSLPQRRFIPDEGQTFKREILSKIKSMAKGSDVTISEVSEEDDGGV